MQVTIDQAALAATLDVLVELWRSKAYPYDRPDAVLPQITLPASLRKSDRALACFYFYACIYMRGGIKSLQAFRALIQLYLDIQRYPDMPNLFDPAETERLLPGIVEGILAKYVGWDARNAAINWVENSCRLMASWGGNPLNLLAGLTSEQEAIRRIRNKRTRRDKIASGPDGAGFRGFQPKMVSMLLYFFDWEGWLATYGEGRFVYSTPADFHNFRIGFNQRAIILVPHSASFRIHERISAAWRAAVRLYILERKADPVEVADALWLFSLVMCGNSPLTQTRSEGQHLNGSGMFDHEDLPHTPESSIVLSRANRLRILETCGCCPLEATCRYAIPAAPYYKAGRGNGGVLKLQPRPRVSDLLGATLAIRNTRRRPPNNNQLQLFEPDE